MSSIARAIHRVSRALQSRMQGIPGIGAHIYHRLVARRVLRALYRLVARELSEKCGKSCSILDVGCGPGALIAQILSEGIRATCIGLDISLAMAEIARREAINRGIYAFVDLVVGDSQLMPFRSRSVDIAVSTGALHHFPKPRNFFSECSRVVRDRCVVYELSFDVPRDEIKRVERRLGRAAWLYRAAGVLHGIPRSDFLAGSMARELRESGAKYSIEFLGPITKVVISPSHSSSAS